MEAISTSAIDKVIGLAPARVLEIDGFKYIDKDDKVTKFTPPAPEILPLTTLSGFVALMENRFETFDFSNTFVHVLSHDTVELVSLTSDRYGRRQVYLRSKALAPDRTFKFNQFMQQEEFNIALRSMFVQDDDVDALIAISGNLAANNNVAQEDDGFTQTVTAKAGIVRLATIAPKPRVTLRPFRTFLEVEQPKGEFVFRVKNDERLGNMCALFEADGGLWKHKAMDNVQTWLSNKIKTSEVEIITAVPVIA